MHAVWVASKEALDRVKRLPEVDWTGDGDGELLYLIGKPVQIKPDAEGIDLVEPERPPRSPRRLRADQLHDALVAAGVIRAGEAIRRIVIDAEAGNVVKVHLERWGDERLLDVVRTLDGIQVYGERR